MEICGKYIAYVTISNHIYKEISTHRLELIDMVMDGGTGNPSVILCFPLLPLFLLRPADLVKTLICEAVN